MNNIQYLVEAGARSWRFDPFRIDAIPVNARCIVRSSGFDVRSDLDVWCLYENFNPDKLVRLLNFNQDFCHSLVDGVSTIIRYRSDISIRALIGSDCPVCIDITSLPMAIWASAVRIALLDDRELWITYTEPSEYRAHKDPMNTDLFDLNERVGDVVALPGMAKLSGPEFQRNSILCIFLGFEGGRARHITDTIDPEPLVIPIVAVPGMHVEYSIQAIECNREFLKNTNAFNQIRWVDSVCPFSAYQLLEQLHKEYPNHYMYIAPVGTKPHALGTLLYSIRKDQFTEILYDHPTARKQGTLGLRQTHLYRLN